MILDRRGRSAKIPKYRHGVIVRRYSAHGRFGFDPELYAVRWDDGSETQGHFRHGLLFDADYFVDLAKGKK